MPADPRGSDLETLEAGLDVLDLAEVDRQPLYLRVLRVAGPPTAAVITVVAVWQLLVSLHVQPSSVLPSPREVASTLGAQWQHGAVQEAVWNSVHRAALGFLASVVVATPLGLLVGRVRVLRAALGSTLSGLQSLPSVAWVPAALIWFGPTNAAIYAVVLLGAVPSIAIGMVAGLDQVPPLHLRVGRVLGAHGLRLARHVLLPSALPGYLAGLKQGWAFSWRALMAAELISRSPRLGLGLGRLLQNGRELSDMRLVFGTVLVILAVGVAVDVGLFRPLERHVLNRRGLLARAT